jgi:phage tail-like protein
MARSSTQDPLEKFRFQVSWSSDGSSESTALVRTGFHDVQLPKRSTNKILYREGNDPDISSVSAGLSAMEDVVMSRGLLYGESDAHKELYRWMSSIHKPTAGITGYDSDKHRTPDAAKVMYRKTVTIEMYDREGKATRMWVLYNAFPVHFVPGSDLNAREDGDKSLESLTLSYEDFQEIDVTSKAPV